MTTAAGRSIDLNADVGEGAGHDAELMRFISSANIACGSHAGDDETIAATVRLARRHRVAIGAHPGHADRAHFGRRELPVTPDAAAALVIDQVARLEVIANEPPRHVKLHGGLYHQVARDPALAEAVTAAIVKHWPSTILVAPAGSVFATVASDRGLAVAAEAFIDRAYAHDGSLVSRSEPGATIDQIQEVATQAIRVARDGAIETIHGSLLPIHADTLCIHGDGRHPGTIAAAVRLALKTAGITVRAP